MAKKTKKAKKTYRRRRVGAMALNAQSDIVKYGSVAVGFLMAGTINPMIDKVAGTMDQKIVAGAQVGLGAAYLLTKGKKNLPLTVASGVVAGAGLKRAMTAFGIGRLGSTYHAVPAIGNYASVPAIGNGGVGAYRTNAGLNGYRPNAGLNGYTPKSGVVGSVPGSGILSGSNCMG